MGLGRIWVLSGKRKADVARPNGRPFDLILARKTDKCQRLPVLGPTGWLTGQLKLETRAGQET